MLYFEKIQSLRRDLAFIECDSQAPDGSWFPSLKTIRAAVYPLMHKHEMDLSLVDTNFSALGNDIFTFRVSASLIFKQEPLNQFSREYLVDAQNMELDKASELFLAKAEKSILLNLIKPKLVVPEHGMSPNKVSNIDDYFDINEVSP